VSVNAPRARHFDPALVSAHPIKARSTNAATRGRTHDRTRPVMQKCQKTACTAGANAMDPAALAE
jgi:hypothetical protein